MENLVLPNLLLIAGTGRNSGKTMLACSIIRKFSKFHPVIAIKIAPHVHEQMQDMTSLFTSGNLFVAQEMDDSKPKDSSRMLAAGARKSFFIMAGDEQLPVALQQVLSRIDQNDVIVCESGGLRNIVRPGLFFMMSRSENPTLKPGQAAFNNLCDQWIVFDGKQSDFSVDSIEIQHNTWKLIR